MSTRKAVLACLVLLGTSILSQAASLDSGLFTTYTSDSAKTTLNWIVCGSIGTGTGCFAAGSVGPFGRMGSIIEGSKTYNNTLGTVTRYLYVMDQQYGSSGDEVALYAYKRVDTINTTDDTDTVTFTLEKTVSLPLTGGSSALVLSAGNAGYLVIGTSLSNVPVEVSKRNYAVTKLTIISQIPTQITADNYGYITVTSADEFFVVGPTGSLEEDGGGTPFTINTLLGIQP